MVLAAAATQIAAVSASAQGRAAFNIPSQKLETALYAFADQSHASLALPNERLGEVASTGLNGRYDAPEALRRLLNHTGYGFEQSGQDAYRIFLLRAQPSLHSETRANANETIIVTARRPTTLGELPRSISHVDATQLAGARDANDLVATISGLSLTNVGQGRDKIILRGVSDGSLTGRAQSTVGIYFDGVRLTYAAPDPALQLVDIEHVDVLRGPQGALYGAGSIGGIVSIQSNPVDLTHFEGNAYAALEGTQGGAMSSDAEVVLNAPVLPGRFGVRGVAYREHVGGWLDNAVIGASDTNTDRRSGVRLSALLDNSTWSLTTFGIYQAIDSSDAHYLVAGSGDPTREANLREPHDNDFTTFGATLRATTAWGDLTSTSALVRHKIESRYDATGAFATLGVDPALVRPFDEQDTLKIFINESRLTSFAGARVPWVVGLFLADGESDRDYALRDGAPGIWPDLAYRERRTDAVDEAALFGEVSWPLAHHLTFSTGLRVSAFDVRTHSDTSENISALSDQFAGESRKITAAPDLRLSYQPQRNWLFYLSAARGYRGGGFNTGGPIGVALGPLQPTRSFAGDDLWAFELGTRLSLFSGRLNLDATLFHNIWSNIQTDALIANGFPYTGNVGDGEATGLEASAAWRATDHLTLSANALFNETELTSRDPAFLPATRGAFPGAPDFSGGVSARYQRALTFGALDARFYAQGSANYTGEARLSYQPGQNVGGYYSISARMGILVGAWDAALYGENLGNAEGATFAFGNPYLPSGGAFVTPPRPQTLGLAIRRSF